MAGKLGFCRTPGTVYETDIQADAITFRVLLPRPILTDLDQDEHDRVVKEIHDGALPTIEWLFSRAWVDHFADRPLTDHDRPMPRLFEELSSAPEGGSR